MDNITKILNDKKLVLNSSIVKVLDKNISLIEFLIIIYLDNNKTNGFDLSDISKTFNIDKDLVMESFNKLVINNIVNISSSKDKFGMITESVSLDNLYKMVASNLSEEGKKEDTSNVYEMIEKEFGRPLSPNEYEIINGWISTGTSNNLIIGAIKEAVYNGVKTFRYIDRIIYEWTKKGFKTMDDVNKHLKSIDDEKNNQELFDYDWLEDDE